MTDSHDPAFEDAVREMLHRRAADVGQNSIETNALDLTHNPATPRNGRWLVAVAAGIAVLGLGVTALAMTLFADEAIDIEATQPSTDNEPTNPNWLTATPSLELLPAGVLTPSTFVFGPGETPAAVADSYLADRLPILSDRADEFTVTETEVVDGHALYRWDFADSSLGVGGWLYLRRVDGGWWVVASTTDGVDAHRLNVDSRGLQGIIASTLEDLLHLDLVDLDTGEPFDPATGELIPPDDLGRRFGTAADSSAIPAGQEVQMEIDLQVARQQYGIRVQAVGGTFLSISEFVLDPEVAETDLTLFVDPAMVETVRIAIEADPRTADHQVRTAANARAERYGRFNEVPEVTEIWTDEAQLVTISLALATMDAESEVIADLLAIEGVVAAVPNPPSTSEPGDPAEDAAGPQDDAVEDEAEAEPLIIDTQTVDFVPAAIECEAPVGIPTPPNSEYEITEPLVAPDPEGALVRFLSETPEPPPWSARFVKLIAPDGSISFGYATEPERYLGMISVAEVDGGWSVTRWEIVGC